jgi:hypothetical protein
VCVGVATDSTGLLVSFPTGCLSEVACSLFDRMLKVEKRNKGRKRRFLIPEKKKKNRFQNTRNRLSLGKEVKSADLLTTNSGSTTLLRLENDEYRKHLLLPTVKCWQQRIYTLSQGQKIALLAIHRSRGCNILAGATTCIHKSVQWKETTQAQRRTITNEREKSSLEEDNQ